MSIYATLWRLKFPRDGDDYLGCEWITVIAQGVPPHIGSPTPGCGYEDGDPYATFLPPPVHTDEDGESAYMRAVVFVTEGTPKGTTRSPQEYQHPLLVLTGEVYAHMTFATCIRRSVRHCAVTGPALWRSTWTLEGAYISFLRTARPEK